jgi:hypothetical protein
MAAGYGGYILLKQDNRLLRELALRGQTFDLIYQGLLVRSHRAALMADGSSLLFLSKLYR